MRKLGYKLELSEFAYMIASGPINYDDVRGHECLPIKVIIPDGYEFEADIQGLISSVELGDDDQWFSEHYKEILLGSNPDWYLFWVEVYAEAVHLHFYSRESGQDVTMMLQSELTGGRCLKFQFDVPHQNGRSDSRYDIDLIAAQPSYDNHGKIYYKSTVTEYFAYGYRELLFTTDNRSDDLDGRYALVTEYVDE